MQFLLISRRFGYDMTKIEYIVILWFIGSVTVGRLPRGYIYIYICKYIMYVNISIYIHLYISTHVHIHINMISSLACASLFFQLKTMNQFPILYHLYLHHGTPHKGDLNLKSFAHF